MYWYKKDENGTLFLSHLYVKFDFKRYDIGGKLLELAEKSARERGYKEYKELYMKKAL